MRRLVAAALAAVLVVGIAHGAMDTEQRRRSAVGRIGLLPVADGSIDAGARAHLAGVYSAFFDSSGTVGSTSTATIHRRRRR